MFGRKKTRKKLDFEPAEDIKKLVAQVVFGLDLSYIKLDQVHCVRSRGSKARAYARTWGLSRIFQVTAGYKPTYVIEVLSHYFDKLDDERKLKVVIHEVLHIPKTFSGALRSHKGINHRVDHNEVEKMYKQLKRIR